MYLFIFYTLLFWGCTAHDVGRKHCLGVVTELVPGETVIGLRRNSVLQWKSEGVSLISVHVREGSLIADDVLFVAGKVYRLGSNTVPWNGSKAEDLELLNH